MKQIKKFFCTILIFFISILSVTANESYDYTYTGVEMWGDKVETANTALINLTDTNGNIYNTYCIDYNTSVVDDHTYSLKNVKDATYINEATADIISNIVLNAYPFSDLEYIKKISKIDNLTEQEAIAGAQAAIWHYANGYDFSLSDNVKKLYNYYLTLGNNPSSSTDIQELTITYNTYFEEGIRNTLITFDDTNTFDLEYSFDKDLEKTYNVTLEKVTKGILIKNIPADAEFQVNVTAKQNINNNVYFFYPEGGETASQSLVGVSKGTINISNTQKIKVQDNYYKVTINKKDSVTGKSIPNVKFIISNTSNFSDYTFEATTNDLGIITFDNITNGTWYIKEVNTPSGYIQNNKITKIEINNQSTNIDLFNDPYGKIKIIKVDESQKRLDNVYFDLYKDKVSEETLIKKDIITNELGEATIENLDKGKYILVETKTKEGYILNTSEIEINVTYGKTSTITITNQITSTGNLIIRKLDSETNKLLENAIIGIYKDEDCTELYLEITTTTDEQIINDIPIGTYYIKEIKAPKGYLLNLDTHSIEITKDETATLDILNNKIYQTSLKHYTIAIVGIISLITFTLIYLGYNLWKRKI